MKTKKRILKPEKVVFLEIEELREHEEIRPDYLEALKNEILTDGILKMPICIDEKTCIILDGHHRLHALKRLGCKRIPCVLVDYHSPDIRVIAWREGETITKDKVVDTALSGGRMPSKTSKHMIILDGEWTHISAIEMIINVPLEKLK
jgi:ParB-like chromosome segregation protein Spo0J